MKKLSELLAHSKGHCDKKDLLLDHLVDVADKAKIFADCFGCGTLAYWLGIFHDLGKVNPDFQEYLKAMEEEREHPKVPHAVWGASLMYHYCGVQDTMIHGKSFAYLCLVIMSVLMLKA